MYRDESLKKYLDDLAARAPTPGGGSAAALNAALAASLVSMVANFTLGKSKYARFEADVKKILASSEKLRKDFLNLVDLDVKAYNSKNLRESLNVPFMTARLCFEGIKLCLPLATKGNINLSSDCGTAAALFDGAFSGASFSVDINLKLLGDKRLAKQVRKELDQKAKVIKKLRAQTEAKIGKIIRG
ncbi:MAG: cyclodeaminase/cyclohydrolase family protein [Candidatus Omnitrophica bacterium]|nr:cyclodeaminase/cyclohydrolase family protein [Candidatus Omnitrophota bacterium]